MRHALGRFELAALGAGLAGILACGDPSAGPDSGEMGDALPAVDLGPGAEETWLTVGSEHACVLLEGGAVKCWGDNDSCDVGVERPRMAVIRSGVGGGAPRKGSSQPRASEGAGR